MGPLGTGPEEMGLGSPPKCLVFSHKACLAHSLALRRGQGDQRTLPGSASSCLFFQELRSPACIGDAPHLTLVLVLCLWAGGPDRVCCGHPHGGHPWASSGTVTDVLRLTPILGRLPGSGDLPQKGVRGCAEAGTWMPATWGGREARPGLVNWRPFQGPAGAVLPTGGSRGFQRGESLEGAGAKQALLF